MRKLLIVSVTGLTLFAGTAFSAGPFDGTYQGGAGPTCRMPQTSVTLTVADGIVSGTSAWGSAGVAVKGKVGADGTFRGTIGGEMFSGKFEGKTFEATYTSSGGGTMGAGCRRLMHLERKG